MIQKYFPSIIILLGLVLNIHFLQSPIVGILFFALYLVVSGLLWSDILSSIVSVREKYISIPLGIFVTILGLSFLSSVCVVWFKLPSFFVSLILILFLGFTFWLREEPKGIVTKSESAENFGFIPKSKFVVFCVGAIALLQIAILILCQTENPLLSPWQTLHPWYLYNFFLLTFLLGILLFSKISFQAKFLSVIVYSVLLHLYLPLLHPLPWGGDVWRMIGVEEKLATGEIQPPGFPQAFWNPYKYTYGQVWGLMVVLAKTLSISLLELHRSFMAIFWGLFLPLVSFVVGKQIFQNKQKALFLSALSSFPFALQAIGSITVAVSLGFLTFLFGLFLWALVQREGTRQQKKFLYTYGVLMLFGYALFAVLFWLVIGLTHLIRKLWKGKTETPAWKEMSPKQKVICVSVGIVSLLIFPLLDWVLEFSHWPHNFSLWNFIKSSLGQLGGWYFAGPIGGPEIASANILFNHMPVGAFVSNIFTAFRWPILLLTFLVCVALVRAFLLLLKKERSLMWHVLALIFVCLLGGYILGWYVLTGDRVFVRRLDSALAWFFLLFALFGILSFSFKEKFSALATRTKYILFTVLLFVVSFFATMLYASGPDIRVMSVDEYQAAQFLWQQKKDAPVPCVLADTWILLALEGVSASKIVGGGFPIDQNFGQAERVRLYNELLKNPDARIIPQIAQVTPAPSCLIAISRRDIDAPTEEKFNLFLGNLLWKTGEILIWQLDLKTP